MNRPPMLSYTVHVELASPQLEQEYLAWLRDGHLADVLAGGASSAQVVRLDGGPPARLEVRYQFATRLDFERYEATAAPRLRAEGLARFPPERGVSLRRSLGQVTISLPERPTGS